MFPTINGETLRVPKIIGIGVPIEAALFVAPVIPCEVSIDPFVPDFEPPAVILFRLLIACTVLAIPYIALVIPMATRTQGDAIIATAPTAARKATRK